MFETVDGWTTTTGDAGHRSNFVIFTLIFSQKAFDQ